MTIFREEFDLQFIVYFATLSFLKIFHWLCQDRIEFVKEILLFISFICIVIDFVIRWNKHQYFATHFMFELQAY